MSKLIDFRAGTTAEETGLSLRFCIGPKPYDQGSTVALTDDKGQTVPNTVTPPLDKSPLMEMTMMMMMTIMATKND